MNPLEVRVQHGHQVVAVPAGGRPAGVVRILLDAQVLTTGAAPLRT